jgi:hypothetical protein
VRLAFDDRGLKDAEASPATYRIVRRGSAPILATIGRLASSCGLADALGEGGRFRVEVGECERCRELFSGTLVVGRDPMPPGHVSCRCVAVPIRPAIAA